VKVLWFTNIPLPEMLGKQNSEHTGSGGWMIALLDQLRNIPDLELTVACLTPGLQAKDCRAMDGVRFILVGQGSKGRFFQYKNLDDSQNFLEVCKHITEEVRPDIIHIHGTERPYGLLVTRHMIQVPVVISLQGLLHEYVKRRNYFGVTSFADILWCHHPLQMVRGFGPVFNYISMQHAAKREIEILKGNHWFIGRTLWDRSHLLAFNPSACYFDVPELLRSSFYTRIWQLNSCQRYKIVLTNASSFVRGTELLLDAISFLKGEFPKISVTIAGGYEGETYYLLLKKKINQMGLEDRVTLLGRIIEREMADSLVGAHIFVITSLLENSPNSLCEAQIIGLPCIASYTGGIPSLVQEGFSGLLFPPGDATVLAQRIREIFMDDQLAQKIGSQARKIALKRQDPKRNARQVLNVYESVFEATRS
jgi:glycosyltransferase involved in cell wall biosynthesis